MKKYLQRLARIIQKCFTEKSTSRIQLQDYINTMILDFFNKRSKMFKFKTFKIVLLATIRSWDYPENFGICSQLNRKSKTFFFYFPQCECVLNRMEQSSDPRAFTSKIQVFFRPKWTKGGSPWKWILKIFKYKNEYHKQLELKKQMKKMGSFV